MENSGEAGAVAEVEDVLSTLLAACRTLARELRPFLPAASEQIARALAEGDPQLGRRLFAKVPPRE